MLGWLSIFALGASLVFRTIATGHGPFSNMYEFSIAFAFGILGAYYWFERKYHQRVLALLALPVALGLLAYAATVPASIEPLIPALQNNMLLTVHVATAIVAYGSFTIAFAAALLYLIQPATGRWGLPKPEVLDEISYRAIVIGFPFLTLTVVLGAVWADVAWGTYWSWDPKETASLVTWLLYGAFLHARVVRGWRGQQGGPSPPGRLRRDAPHLLRQPLLRRAPQLQRPGLSGTGGGTTMAMDATQVPVSRPAAAGASRLRTIIVLAVAAVLIGTVAWVVDRPTDDGVTLLPGAAPVGAPPRIGDLPPDFEAKTVDGTAISMAALNGKPTWLTFGASWCPDCRAESTDLQATYAKYQGQGLALLGVFIDEDQAAVQDYAKRVGFTFPMVADPSGKIADLYRTYGIPIHFFIGRDGVIRDVRIGRLSPGDMEQLVQQLVKG